MLEKQIKSDDVGLALRKISAKRGHKKLRMKDVTWKVCNYAWSDKTKIKFFKSLSTLKKNELKKMF